MQRCNQKGMHNRQKRQPQFPATFSTSWGLQGYFKRSPRKNDVVKRMRATHNVHPHMHSASYILYRSASGKVTESRLNSPKSDAIRYAKAFSLHKTFSSPEHAYVRLDQGYAPSSPVLVLKFLYPGICFTSSTGRERTR